MMEVSAILMLTAVCFTLPKYSMSEESLIIIPEVTKLMKLEGDQLKLECKHTYTGETTDVPEFSKDGVVIGISNDKGYNVTVTKKIVEPNTKFISTTTLIKNQTDASDQGQFSCSANPAMTVANIAVYIFTITIEDAELPVITKEKPVEPVQLQCRLNKLPPAVDYNYTWYHKEGALKDGDKYKIMENGTLQINKPARTDMGEYQCEVTFSPSSTVERHTVRPKPAALKASPEIVTHDNNKNMVQGDDLELKCEVTGYPMPEITWLKDGSRLNSTTRIHFEEYKGAQGKLIIYSLEDADEADYQCFAENSVPPYNATADMRIRVKDKLAALWPFLGIVAEVIVLCVIILVYEKRRSKKLAEEEDAVDSNQENTADHGDVRHRRT